MKKRMLVALLILTACFSLVFCEDVFSQTLELNNILVSPAGGSAAVGDVLTFQVTLTNNGRLNIIEIALTDLYSPQYFEYISADPAPDLLNRQKGEINWNNLSGKIGAFELGDTITLSIIFRALALTDLNPAANTVSARCIDELQAVVPAGPVSAFVNIIQQCPNDIYEPNDAPKAAAKISPGEEIRAYICPEDDEDYFQVDLREPGAWFFHLYGLPADYNLYVYDDFGLVSKSENTGTMPETAVVNNLLGARYFVQVKGRMASSYRESYRLKIISADASAIVKNQEVEPGHMVTLMIRNLLPGDPGKPNTGHYYLGPIEPGNLLASAPVLPNGCLVASVKIPEDAGGDQSIVAQVVDSGDNVVSTVQTIIRATTPKAILKLWIDDAWKASPSYVMPVVNKVKIPTNSKYGGTIVDVCCSVKPKAYTGDIVRVEVMIAGDKLGFPEKAFTRSGHGGLLEQTLYWSKGDGVYYALLSGIQQETERHVVFRFRVPEDLPNGIVDVTAKVFAPDNEQLHSYLFPRKIRILAGCDTVIFANRTTLYRDHDHDEVSDLLGNLCIHSDSGSKEAPMDHRAVIHYIDQYIDKDSLHNWDNMEVDYSTEFRANEVARICHEFMTNRFDNFVYPKPDYLLIVGNDEQFPFYRLKDPALDEHAWLSFDRGNPALMATVMDYYFTDSYYTSWHAGPVIGHWTQGKVDLKIGRIIGDSAADMLQLYLRGNNVLGSTGRAVMASVDGVELGFEPDDGRKGEIPDFTNVPALFSEKGIDVRNDNESPRTIDVLKPYAEDWDNGFMEAANEGMDLFFIGGHNDFTQAYLPGSNFFPRGDIPSQYERFDVDNPIAMFVGCHGGLPVPDIGDVDGGVETSMVYNLIHNGVRAYYGPSGFGYGSLENLHCCVWSELLSQIDFYYFLSGNYRSQTLGYAFQKGKMNYPFGLGRKEWLDLKIVTVYNLFGVPWQRMNYNLGSGGGENVDTGRSFEQHLPAPMKKERTLMMKPRKVIKLASDTYQQSFSFQIPSWEVSDYEGFQIIDFPGAILPLTPDAPLLPSMAKHSIALPPDAEILSLQADGITTQAIGNFNIPTVRVGAFSQSGITYTDESDIDYFYPTYPAQSHEGSHNHHLISVFPIRHNPATKETIVHSDFQVHVTYKAAVPFGILDFSAVDSVLPAGQMPSFSAGIFNVGDAAVTLTGSLSLADYESEDGFSTTTMSIPLVPGSVFNLQSSPAGFPDIGIYRAVLRLDDGMGNLVTAETSFSVIGADASNLAALWNPVDNKTTLSVDVENLSNNARILTLAFLIMNSEDIWLDTICSEPSTLAAGERKKITALWHSPKGLTDNLKIQAIGALDGMPLNPANAEMSVFSTEDLFDSMVDYILNRYKLPLGYRHTFDLNGDRIIDVADVISFMKIFN